MIKRLLMAPVFLALSLEAIPLIAQSASAERIQTAQEPVNTDGDNSDVTQQATAPKGSTQKKPPPITSNDSPFDYRSSEKISEDVPVSFPVDI